MLIHLLVALHFISVSSADTSTDKILSFQPESAAGVTLSDLTAAALAFEAQQFYWVGQWHALRDQWEMAKIRSEYLKKGYARAEKLLKTKNISIDAFAFAKYQYDSSLNEVRKLEAEVDKANASAALAKLQLLEETSSASEYLRRITETRLLIQKAQLTAFEAQLATTELEAQLLTQKLNNSKVLAAKNVISAQEIEAREFAMNKAIHDTSATKNQIQITKDTIAALEKTLKRL